MENINLLSTISFLLEKKSNNIELTSKEENILKQYDELINSIINLHGTHGRELGLPPLEKVLHMGEYINYSTENAIGVQVIQDEALLGHEEAIKKFCNKIRQIGI